MTAVLHCPEPQRRTKDICHISLPHRGTRRNAHPEGLSPAQIPPTAHPPWGDTHQLPVLQPHDLRDRKAVRVTLQRQGLPGHARHVGLAPVLPDAGGHLGARRAKELPPCPPRATAKGTPSGPFPPLHHWGWRRSACPHPPSHKGSCGPADGRSSLALGPTHPQSCPGPGATLSHTQHCRVPESPWIHLVLHPTWCHSDQGGSP